MFPVFLNEIKSKTLIKILRHSSLPMNVIYRIMKFQIWGYDGKLVILNKKIKVKKWDFNLYLNKSKHIGVYIA